MIRIDSIVIKIDSIVIKIDSICATFHSIVSTINSFKKTDSMQNHRLDCVPRSTLILPCLSQSFNNRVDLSPHTPLDHTHWACAVTSYKLWFSWFLTLIEADEFEDQPALLTALLRMPSGCGQVACVATVGVGEST